MEVPTCMGEVWMAISVALSVTVLLGIQLLTVLLVIELGRSLTGMAASLQHLAEELRAALELLSIRGAAEDPGDLGALLRSRVTAAVQGIGQEDSSEAAIEPVTAG